MQGSVEQQEYLIKQQQYILQLEQQIAKYASLVEMATNTINAQNESIAILKNQKDQLLIQLAHRNKWGAQ